MQTNVTYFYEYTAYYYVFEYGIVLLEENNSSFSAILKIILLGTYLAEILNVTSHEIGLFRYTLSNTTRGAFFHFVTRRDRIRSNYS